MSEEEGLKRTETQSWNLGSWTPTKHLLPHTLQSQVPGGDYVSLWKPQQAEKNRKKPSGTALQSYHHLSLGPLSLGLDPIYTQPGANSALQAFESPLCGLGLFKRCVDILSPAGCTAGWRPSRGSAHPLPWPILRPTWDRMAGDLWFFTWQGIADELQVLVDRGENFVARTVDDGPGWYLPLIGLKRAREMEPQGSECSEAQTSLQLAPRVSQLLVRGLGVGTRGKRSSHIIGSAQCLSM